MGKSWNPQLINSGKKTIFSARSMATDSERSARNNVPSSLCRDLWAHPDITKPFKDRFTLVQFTSQEIADCRIKVSPFISYTSINCLLIYVIKFV